LNLLKINQTYSFLAGKNTFIPIEYILPGKLISGSSAKRRLTPAAPLSQTFF